MKIAVVGTINRDIIITHEGERRVSLGGIAYNTVALAALCPTDIIVPVAYYGSDAKREIEGLFGAFNNIDSTGMAECEQGTNENVLKYLKMDTREEVLDVRVPQIEFGMLEGLVKCDFVLVNFISGNDMTIDTLKKFRRESSGTLYMDVHSLTLGIDEKGRRFDRVFENWSEWARCADLIQMSRKEASYFTGITGPIESTAKLVCSEGPRVCIVTLGEGGVLVTGSGREGFVQAKVDAVPADVRDTTGCGDVFSAAFISSFSRGCDALESAREGCIAAARCSECMGIEGLEKALLR
jgi:sugar/nucleoside kinase (ribokinase family)